MNFNDRLTMLVDALPGVNRIKAVQRALDGRTNPVYLEIGVSKGLAFRQISADEKIAVDPAFRLSDETRAQADARGRATHYFEVTSDDFFATQGDFLAQRPIDVALIDGMHTYEQVVRDVENTLRFLRDDGVIFLHDCNPPFELAGRRAESWDDFIAGQSGPWSSVCGTVTCGRRSSICAAPGPICWSVCSSAIRGWASCARGHRNPPCRTRSNRSRA